MGIGPGRDTGVVDVSSRESITTKFRSLEAGTSVGNSRGAFGAEVYESGSQAGLRAGSLEGRGVCT